MAARPPRGACHFALAPFRISLNRGKAPDVCLPCFLSENRFPLFRKHSSAFPCLCQAAVSQTEERRTPQKSVGDLACCNARFLVCRPISSGPHAAASVDPDLRRDDGGRRRMTGGAISLLRARRPAARSAVTSRHQRSAYLLSLASRSSTAISRSRIAS